MSFPDTINIAVQVARHFACPLGEIVVGRYASDMMYINNPNDYDNKHVAMIVNLYDEARITHLIMLIMQLSSQPVRRITLVLTSYPYGTEDRDTGKIVTARYVLDAIWNATRSPMRIFMCEPHCLQLENFGVGGATRIDVMKDLLSFCVADSVSASSGSGSDINVCIVFPDDGANKRYGPVANALGYSTVICSKTRYTPNSVSVRVIGIDSKQTAENTVFVIADDMTRSGGTLIECAEALRIQLRTNDVDIRVAIVHGDFVDSRVIERMQACGIKRLVITDSTPNKSRYVSCVAREHFVREMSIAPCIIRTIGHSNR